MKNQNTEYFEVGGKSFPVVSHRRFRVKETGELFSLPVIDSQTDYDWFILALASRIVKPEVYLSKENIETTVQGLR